MSKKTSIPFTDDDVNELLALLDAGPYDRLELETGRFKLSLARTGEDGWTREVLNLDRPESLAGPDDAARREETPEAGEAEREEVIEGLDNVPAPMGGVFYRAPKPGADPFIQVGDRVGKDTVIAIIEVMKLMNSVHAGVEGEIVEILPENADFVAQGQTLLRVKPD